MKIRKIKFENHPIFKNLELDFTNHRNETVETIIIAGDNGVGKSLILNTIFELSAQDPFGPEIRDERRTFEIELSDRELTILKNGRHTAQYFTSSYSNNIFTFSINYNIQRWERFQITANLGLGYFPSLPSKLFAHDDTRRILKTLFSDVEVNFTPDLIETIKTSNIDNDSPTSQKSYNNLATEITQLLVDVQSLDALEFTDWAKSNRNQHIDERKIDIRMKRFSSAFEYMFPSKKYKTVKTTDGKKSVVFQEFDREMEIGQLSSGEKQIVFRGSFLLKDKESSKGALVLIDEPEISLHPKWQLKILSFFKKLFTSDENLQTSQIIVTTHSPFIIHNSNRSNDKVVILKKDDAGVIYVQKEPEFFNWTNEQFIQNAYDISEIDFSRKITVFVEGITDEKYYRKCLEIYGLINSVEFDWIGRLNDKGSPENTGNTALNQAKTFFHANPSQLKGKIVLFYDCDTFKPEENFENLYVRTMAKNEKNSRFEIGVENLLTIVPELNIENFYNESISKDKYGGTTITTKLNKTALCDYICNELSVENQKIILENLFVEVNRIMEDPKIIN